MYCAGCSVTPYCSEGCQRRDWPDRHKAVCHNLARLDRESKKRPEPEPEPIIAPAAPLRRPNNRRDPPSQDDERSKVTKFIPHGERNQAHQSMAKGKPSPSRTNRNFNGNKTEMRRPQLDRNDDETWDTKPQSPQKAKPAPEPTPVKVPQSAPKNVTADEILSFVKPKPKVEPEKPVEIPVKVTPVKPAPVKIEPAEYLVEKLPIGGTFLASIEAPTSKCSSKQPGFVCLTVHENFADTYNKLCIDYTEECEKETETVNPTPGALISFLSVEDGGWFRARCLSRSRAALIDACKLADIAQGQCKPMLPQYRQYPEFCAVLQATEVTIGANLKCTIKSKTDNGFRVSIVETESGADFGEGEVSRWVPEVEMPTPVAAPAVKPSIPSVSRPDVKEGERVVLLDVTSLDRAAVRAYNTTAAFDSILNDIVFYGTKAIPLKEPPKPGQIVVAMFQDGVHYRALVKRTKAAENRYLIEYIEFGNEEKVPLERLYECPAEYDLTKLPALATIVKLSTKDKLALTPPAIAYIEKLKDNYEELILTIPSGEKTAPSGSLVNLTLAKNNESLNKKLEQMCTPDWVKLEERGGDVLETEAIMFEDLKNSVLPTDKEFTLEIVDFELLKLGSICGYVKGDPLADIVYGSLTEKMNKYCESDLCKEPYLPRPNEVCITKYLPYTQWFRAVLMKQEQGPGGLEAQVLYIDYGTVGTVPVKDLRKMLPEFVDGYPALANQIEIEDFPEDPSVDQLRLALEMLNVDSNSGRGSILVKKCIKCADKTYKIQVPELIAALKAVG